jgi:hypothetical protein
MFENKPLIEKNPAFGKNISDDITIVFGYKYTFVRDYFS